MTATQEQFNTQRRATTALANGLREAIVTPITNGDGSILDNASAGQNITAGIDNTFLSEFGDSAPSLAIVMANSVRNSILDSGVVPSDELLASAAQAMQNIMSKSDNILDSASLSTTAGIPYRNQMIALTLPSMLNMITADDVMMIPASFDKNEIFRVERQAGTTFGDLEQGDIIDEFFSGQYGSMDQFKNAGLTDGSKTVFAVDYAQPLANARTMAYIDGILVIDNQDTGSATVAKPHKGGTLTLATNYSTGAVTLTLSGAALEVSGLKVEIKADIKIENNETVIPTIEHTIHSHIIRTHEGALASSTSIQARLQMQREFGLNQDNMNIAAATNILAADKDRRNLFMMNRAARRGYIWGIQAPASGGDSTKDHAANLGAFLNEISTDMMSRNKKSGIKTVYVGKGALAYLGYLPEGQLKYVAGYHEIPQPHVVGMLFGRFRVKYSPMIEGMEMLLVAKGSDYGDAGIVNGDAIPAIAMKHTVAYKSLRNENTLYEVAVRDIHPHNGTEYFARLTLDPSTSGKQG